MQSDSVSLLSFCITIIALFVLSSAIVLLFFRILSFLLLALLKNIIIRHSKDGVFLAINLVGHVEEHLLDRVILGPFVHTPAFGCSTKLPLVQHHTVALAPELEEIVEFMIELLPLTICVQMTVIDKADIFTIVLQIQDIFVFDLD